MSLSADQEDLATSSMLVHSHPCWCMPVARLVAAIVNAMVVIKKKLLSTTFVTESCLVWYLIGCEASPILLVLYYVTRTVTCLVAFV